MTLNEIIDAADMGYEAACRHKGDQPLSELVPGIVRGHWDAEKGETIERPEDGRFDGLALFIVIEIKETFDPEASDEDQIQEAVRVLDVAQTQLGSASGYILSYWQAERMKKPTPIQAAYERGVCPDCGEDISFYAVEGSDCINCGHVFRVAESFTNMLHNMNTRGMVPNTR